MKFCTIFYPSLTALVQNGLHPIKKNCFYGYKKLAALINQEMLDKLATEMISASTF